MPRAPKSFHNPRLSKDLNASRRSEPRLNRELPQQVPDLIHARREAGHPYKYTTKDVRDVELGLDTTRSDDLEILRVLGSGGGKHTSKRKGLAQ